MLLPTLTGDDARAAAVRAARRLAADDRVQLVYLYGSAADSTRGEVHDVDLAIACRPRLELDELMRLRADAVAAAGAPLDLIVAVVTRAPARYWDFKPFLEEQWRLAGERLAERRRDPETV